MEIRHWDEDDEPEFLLITDSKTQATINCTAETVRGGGREEEGREGGREESVFDRSGRHILQSMQNALLS